MTPSNENGASVADKAVAATKWSVVTQLASKLISPVTTLVLAHILAPEAFGVVALVTMVTSFADMFSDAGFQKYLIQHEYGDGEDFPLSANVAFWTNLAVSMALWALIALARDPLAAMLGNPEIGPAIAVACASLPLTALVSVQTAVYQRSFDFKTLFYSRIGSASLVFLASVPLAFAGLDYWAMICGTLASNLFLAVWLTWRSEWRPALRYSARELGRMFSFSAWTLVEAFSIWLTSWVGAFVLGTMMDARSVGLYNTSVSLASAVVGVVTGAVMPVAFAALSRLQGDRRAFDAAFYKMQLYLAFCVVPIAAALFVFRDAVVGILLGSAWLDTALFLGLYALASAFVVVFCHISSEVYRALGKPRYSLLAQLGFLAVYVPALVFGAQSGYAVFSIVVPAARLVGFTLVHFMIMGLIVRLSPLRMIANLRWIYLATLIASLPCAVAIWAFDLNIIAQVLLAVVFVAAYIVLVFALPAMRAVLFDMARRFGFAPALARAVPRKWSDELAAD